MHINRKLRLSIYFNSLFLLQKVTVLYCKTNGILCCSALSKFKDHQANYH